MKYVIFLAASKFRNHIISMPILVWISMHFQIVPQQYLTHILGYIDQPVLLGQINYCSDGAPAIERLG